MTQVSSSEVEELGLEELERRASHLSQTWIDVMLGDLEQMGTSERRRASDEAKDVSNVLEALRQSLEVIALLRAGLR